MSLPDKYGRKWNGRNVRWVRTAMTGNMASYRWGVNKNGERSLIFDSRGMLDRYGYNVKNSKVELRPVLEGKYGESWEPFPDTDDAQKFKKSLRYTSVVSINDDDYGDDDIIVK